MKSSWIGIGFSHQSVPSLSNTATRSCAGTASGRPSPQILETNSTMARFAGPSRQLERLAVVLMRRTLRASTVPHIARNG